MGLELYDMGFSWYTYDEKFCTVIAMIVRSSAILFHCLLQKEKECIPNSVDLKEKQRVELACGSKPLSSRLFASFCDVFSR